MSDGVDIVHVENGAADWELFGMLKAEVTQRDADGGRAWGQGSLIPSGSFRAGHRGTQECQRRSESESPFEPQCRVTGAVVNGSR